MPPKAKEIARKVVVPVNRPDISDASLNFVPGDAVEGTYKYFVILTNIL